MSQRMSRREMRKAGLLKPRPATDPEKAQDEDPDSGADDGTQQMATVFTPEDSVSAAEPATPSTPADAAEVPADETELSEESGAGSTGESVESLADEQPAMSDEPVRAEDAQLAHVSETFNDREADRPRDADSGDIDKTPGSDVAPERTSVFDRFSNDEDRDSSSDDAVKESAETATVGNETVKSDSLSAETDETTENDDDDFAGALRAKLQSTPPAESSPSATDVADDGHEGQPSRWKTAIIFVILIVVGFGVGIGLGSLIFSSGADPSVAPPVLSPFSIYNPGAL